MTALNSQRQVTLASIAAGLVSFVLYCATMNPTVSFIDSGELAAASTLLGIAHPTGYPLFTILGRLAAIIPVGGETIARLNLAGALLVAASISVFFSLSMFLQNAIVLFPAAKRTKGSRVFTGSAFVTALVLAFSTTVWAQSVAVEVYSLHIFFLMIVMLAFLKGLQATVESRTISASLLLFSFLLGLSFSNHMTTLLLAPAFLYLYFVTLRWNGESLTLLLKLSPWFLLGLSVYFFLPLRSSASPPLDWGHPAEPERFLWHVSGKQYRSWIFSSFESAERQLRYFFEHLSQEFHWLVIGLVVLGLWSLFWNRRRLFVFVGLLVIGCLVYAVNYDIHDIDAYFLLAYIAFGSAAVFGVARVAALISERLPGRWSGISWVPFLILPILQWWGNGPRVDESDNFLVHDYTRSILESLDSNAVVLTYQWDYFISASYYEQHVKGTRPDVVIIDKELLRRSWYFLQIGKNYPWLVRQSRKKIDAFLRALSAFEHDLPYNGQVIEMRYNEMINDIIDKCFEIRPVYLGPEIEPQFGPLFTRVPEGLMLRLSKPGQTDTLKQVAPFYRPTRFQSRLTKGLQTQYAQGFTMQALWKMEKGDPGGASRLLERAQMMDPAYLPAFRLRERLGVSADQNR